MILTSKGEGLMAVQLGKRYSDQIDTGEKDEKGAPILTEATCELLVIKAPPGNNCQPCYNGRPMMLIQPKVLPSAD